LSKRRSILYSAMLLTAANLAMRVVSMLFQVFLSREVGAAGLGLLQLTMTVGMLAMTIGTSGVRVAAMYLCVRAVCGAPCSAACATGL
jgi:stage V sporulation protein B